MLLVVTAAQTINSALITSSNCQPANCATTCSPSCSIDQVCTKKSMTDCGVCPALLCMSRISMGLPPIATTNGFSPSAAQNSSNDTGPLIGGIVGGLVGFGIILGIGIYCYIKKRKQDRLPFAFASENTSYFAQNQEKSQQQDHFQIPQQQVTPHPAVIAALSQQSSIVSSSSSKHREIANQLQRQNSKSFTISATTARLSTIQTPLYSTENSSSNEKTTSTITSRPITSNVPEEFESKVHLQNKRISEILYHNARLSQQPQIQHAQPRYSAYTSTDEDFDSEEEEEEEEDKKSALSTSTMQSDWSPQTAKTASVQAIQVARAKPQIMRVNSVKNTNGLNRSESVRTILTAIEHIQDLPSTSHRRHSANEDNPFQDKHSDNTTQ